MKFSIIILVICLIGEVSFAQGEFKLGLLTGPNFSWVNTNNALINGNGLNAGFELGLTSELSLSDHVYLTMGAAIAFNRGGQMMYDIGGNFLPKSSLSSSELNSGDKPLPDGTNIRYSLQVFHIPTSLKLKTTENGSIRYFIDAPRLDWGIVTRARGTIKGFAISSADKENIKKDIVPFQLSMGIGTGMEYNISDRNTAIIGIYWNRTLFDITKNNGKISKTLDDNGTPNNYQDDELDVSREKSRAWINNLEFKVGLLF